MAKVKAPVEEFIANKAESSPPFNDQVTVSSAVKVFTVETFSLIDIDEVASPSIPDGPLINGLVSSTSLTETVRV